MYVAPESKVMMAMANVVSTSPTEAAPAPNVDDLPSDDFD